jgi:hypothetical protein
MARRPRLQYQIKAEPPPAIAVAIAAAIAARHFYYPWSEPVRLKRGLRPYLQHFFEASSRYLPHPNVTARMSAVDTDNYNDKMSAFINVYVPKPVPEISLSGANTSIIEE